MNAKVVKLSSGVFLASAFLAVFAIPSHAGTFDCKTLISGNANGKAYATAESVDLSITVDARDAQVRGTMTVKEGPFYREGEVVTVAAYFTDGKTVKRSGDSFTITSFDRNLLQCNLTNSPCRHWEEMTFNLKTKEVTFEKSYSYSAYVGERKYSHSLKLSCQ
jgi:hypothetical protein